MPGVTLLRAHTIGLAAAAIVLTDRAAPEIAGRGQLVIQSRSPLLQTSSESSPTRVSPFWLFIQQPEYTAPSLNSRYLHSCCTPTPRRGCAFITRKEMLDPGSAAPRRAHQDPAPPDEPPTDHGPNPN